MTSPEQAQPSFDADIVNILQEIRHANAEEQAYEDIKHCLAHLHDQYLSDSSLVEGLVGELREPWGVRYGAERLRPSDYMFLDILGQSTGETIQFTQKETSSVVLTSSCNERVTLMKEGDWIDAQYDSSAMGQGETAYQAFCRRRKESGVYGIIHSAVEQLDEVSVLPEDGVTLDPIFVDKDIHGALTLLVGAEILDSTRIGDMYQEIAEGVDATLVIAKYIQNTFGVMQQEEEIVSCALRDSWGTWACINTSDKTVQIGFRPNVVAQYYHESSAFEEDYEHAFIDTECGKEMTSMLQKQGLTLHPRWLQRMVYPCGVKGDSDDGVDMLTLSTYARLTREIAKSINGYPEVHVESLFTQLTPELIEDLRNGNYDSLNKVPKISEEDSADVRQRLLQLNASGCSEPTMAFFGLVQGCIMRNRGDMQSSAKKSLKITEYSPYVNNEGCGEATVLFLEGAHTTQVIESDGVLLLQKRAYGEETCLLTEDAYFNNVHVPKGALFEYSARPEGSGWRMLRLTPFAFDKPIDRQVFGEEMRTVREHTDHQFLISRIGGFSLAHLQAYVQERDGESQPVDTLH